MMPAYILALDQGTTSSRAILFNQQGMEVAIAQQEFTQYFPQPGWVEHNPKEIWQTQLHVAKAVITKAGISAADIAAVGITNQRETTVIWNRHTGEPIYNAIVWQDRRTAATCDQLKSAGHAKSIQQKTGLIVDAYFSATKIKWILDEIPGARELANQGALCFGTIDTWLLWQLTQGAAHITDTSNASRTMLCNIHSLDWDAHLLRLLNIPSSILPVIKSSSEWYGTTTLFHPDYAVPITGIAGDQQAALFGQLCTQPGMVKNTYGTGCFMLMNTGEQPVPSLNNLLTTVAWTLNGVTQYALEGSVFIGGAVVQWLRDGLGIIRQSVDIEALAQQVPDNGGVYMVPAFAGLGAPHWDPYAQGTITGLTRGSTAAHVARAAIESIAYQTMDVLKAMEADSQLTIAELRVDGGAACNNLLMQFQADVLNTTTVRPKITETTALGAAYLAGLAVGFWPDVAALQNQWQIEQTFHPMMDTAQRDVLQKGWQQAIKSTRAFSSTD